MEVWCEEEYKKILSINNDDCSFEKTNDSINGSKPDFIFKVFDRENDNLELSSVILEMKTELNSTDEKNKKKNKDFLEKLNKDKINNKAEYGLLVTELEWDKKFVIQKAQKFENIFIIRPEYFLTFLTLIKNFAIKKKEINRINIELKDKKEILDSFDKMKDDILNKCFKHIGTQLDIIEKEVDKAANSVSSIKNAANLIKETHFKTLENKIKDFKINKIIEKIEKI